MEIQVIKQKESLTIEKKKKKTSQHPGEKLYVSAVRWDIMAKAAHASHNFLKEEQKPKRVAQQLYTVVWVQVLDKTNSH